MKRIILFAAATILLALFSITSCKKDDNDKKLPVLTTNEVTEITQVAAVSGGVITFDGGLTITARGICWSTNDTPTINDNKTEDGAGAGAFISQLTVLLPETTYYVRAYATNSAGTGYGMAMSFKTLEALLPVLTSNPVTEITATSAISGGVITYDGFSDIIARGIVWNTSGDPTIDNHDGITNDGTGIGVFNSSLSGLTPNTTYYVRAYATNALGTAYGNQRTFTTQSLFATLTTNTVTNIMKFSAASGGNITADGGTPITARGVAWSTNPTPTIDDNLTLDGTGIGSFTSEMTYLVPATTYYVRAYAINAEGVGYGQQVQFTTLEFTPCPNPIYSTSGYYPVCDDGFSPAFVSQSYQMDITAVIPADTIIWPFPRLPIDSIGIIEIIGLPTGFVYTTDSPSGFWPGNSSGCISIIGCPNSDQVGNYPLILKFEMYMINIPSSLEITCYSIDILENRTQCNNNSNVIQTLKAP